MALQRSFKLKGSQYNIAFSYLVYIWRRKDVVIYIGSSKSGMNRLKDHHKINPKIVLDDDDFEFIPCKTKFQMIELEAQLIYKLNPTLNQRKPSTREMKVDRSIRLKLRREKEAEVLIEVVQSKQNVTRDEAIAIIQKYL